MKVYLDIDGTLIHEELGPSFGKPANGLEGFLTALSHFDVYWLTTHCMEGDPTRAQKLIKQHTGADLHEFVEVIKPTTWSRNKTEALDLSDNFIWFDNDVFAGEHEALAHLREGQEFVKVNLANNPYQLMELTESLLLRVPAGR